MDQNADQTPQAPATDQPNADQETSNKPVDVIRDGSLQASIWRNESDKGPFFATTFTHTYKDRDGEYRDTDSFVAADLLKVAELARESYTRTRDMSREERREAFKEQRQSEQAQGQQKQKNHKR